MSTIGYVLLALIGIAALIGTLRALARKAHACELCHKPRDPRTKVRGAWQYGVLACDDCGKKLEERYKDDSSWREPPPWARP